MPLPLSPEEYAARQGLICPFCLSQRMYTGHLQCDESQAWMPVTCGRCGRQWNDIYKLIGYEAECTECSNIECPGLIKCPKCNGEEHGEAAHTHVVDHGYCRECLRKWQEGDDNA